MELYHGFVHNREIICPNCQKRGFVIAKTGKKKSGISGTKAAAAILTGGLSILVVGLSKKDMVTEAKCKKCGSVWVA